MPSPPAAGLAAARERGRIGGRPRVATEEVIRAACALGVSRPLWLAASRSREHRYPASAGASRTHDERASLPVK